jgi:predicted cobalt transporter CbtA
VETSKEAVMTAFPLTANAPDGLSAPRVATGIEPVLSRLGRGVKAGIVAGIVAGGMGLWLAEPVLDRAVALESARTASEEAQRAANGDPVLHHVELFSRSTQHGGFLLGVLATSIALGVLLAVVHALAFRHDTAPWRTSLRLAGGGFFAVYLVPFARYPANPPGVGDPGTLQQRTLTYLATIVIGIVGVLAANLATRDLRARGWSEPLRQLVVAAVLLTTLALPYALPANGDVLDVPAALQWDFRMSALALAMVMWATLAVTFGLLGERYRTRHESLNPRA